MCLVELISGLIPACLVAVFRVADCLRWIPVSAGLGDWSISLTQDDDKMVLFDPS